MYKLNIYLYINVYNLLHIYLWNDHLFFAYRRELATRDAEQRKRKREEELSAEAQAALEREWQRNFEESRQSRVDSWKAFQSGASAAKQKKAKKLKAFRPPKTKAESR